MKTQIFLLVIAMLLTMGNAPMHPVVHEVVLDASQVASAADIEMAIEIATNYGTQPGIVTLDSSQGEFIYTADDRSINFYFSDITLRSLNQATIGNCADGVFFDDLTANNVVIEGISFVCPEGHGIYAPYLAPHQHASIRNNTFETGPYPAIEILQADFWTITGNHIQSLGTAIYLNETGGTIIRNNHIEGYLGVVLFNSGYDNVVRNNNITAAWQGVLLTGKTLGNRITANKISRVQDVGIYFGDIVAGNHVTANKVACWPGFVCQAVYAESINYQQNKILGNRVVRSR